MVPEEGAPEGEDDPNVGLAVSTGCRSLSTPDELVEGLSLTVDGDVVGRSSFIAVNILTVSDGSDVL